MFYVPVFCVPTFCAFRYCNQSRCREKGFRAETAFRNYAAAMTQIAAAPTNRIRRRTGANEFAS